jgi:hypothetical protein
MTLGLGMQEDLPLGGGLPNFVSQQRPISRANEPVERQHSRARMGYEYEVKQRPPQRHAFQTVTSVAGAPPYSDVRLEYTPT